MSGGFILYDTIRSTAPALPIPPGVDKETALTRGWIVELQAGKTRPTAKYPEGRIKWWRPPSHPVPLDEAIEIVADSKRVCLDADPPDKFPESRLRNLYTGDIMDTYFIPAAKEQP